MSYTSADLLSAIERRSFAPSNQSTFSTTEILALADEETQSLILPAILSVREEFFVTQSDITITANQSSYDVPARAIGMIVREVQLVNSGGSYKDIPRIEPEDVRTSQTGSPTAFYMKGNQIVLYPTPSSTQDTLRVSYFIAPGSLVETSSGAVISAINTTTNVVTVATIPSTWVTGNTFDFLSAKGGQEYKGTDLTSMLVSGTDITFASLPSSLAVGDYVSLAETSPLVQLPPNFRPVLAQAVAARMLQSMNQPGADDASRQLDKIMQAAIQMITPRVIGEDRVLLPSNWF
jgi:hypothetical protein